MQGLGRRVGEEIVLRYLSRQWRVPEKVGVHQQQPPRYRGRLGRRHFQAEELTGGHESEHPVVEVVGLLPVPRLYVRMKPFFQGNEVKIGYQSSDLRRGQLLDGAEVHYADERVGGRWESP